MKTITENEIFYTFTRQQADLQAYYRLRRERYQQVYSDPIGIDGHDVPGDILIAKKGDRVIGGIRISITTPEIPSRLPLEMHGFNLAKLIPQISQYRCGEFSRLCLAPGEKFPGVSTQLLALCFQEAKRRGCRYIFFNMPDGMIEFYQHITKKLGFNLIMAESTVDNQSQTFHLGIIPI